MKNKYDVIIIGAGIGGLIAGCFLSKAGKKVLIVEKNDRVGGCCVSFERRGFKFDAGANIIGSCGKNHILGSIFEKLDLNIDFIKFNPTDRVHFPGRTIDIPAGVDAVIANLKKEFHKESTNIDSFFNLVTQTGNNLIAANLFIKYKNMTYSDLLNHFFQDSLLKNILCFGCGYLGLLPSKLSALSALFLLRSFVVEGAYYPKGGAQIFSDSIADKIREYGGDILLRKKVEKIICKNKRVEGVFINKDNFIKADYVISNADARHTFYDLIGIENIKDDTRLVRKLSKFKPSGSFFVSFIAINQHYSLEGKDGWYFDSYDVEKDFNKLIYVHIPTLMDNSLAPKGKHILKIGTPFLSNFDDIKNWKKVKKELSIKNIGLLERILPGIKESIEFYESASPMTIYKYTFNFQGALFGWEQCPAQVFANAFPSSSDTIENFLLAGHWTFPGGGIVSVAFSGMIAAQKILKKNKSSKIA